MSAISEFFPAGGLKPTSIVNGLTAGFTWPSAVPAISSATLGGSLIYPINQALKVVTSGACTANTLKTILSISGRGAIDCLVVGGVDATSRTHRVKITIDGTSVFDITSAAATAARAVVYIGSGSVADDTAAGGCVSVHGTPIFFDQSLTVEYATSVTETDKTKIGYRYYLR